MSSDFGLQIKRIVRIILDGIVSILNLLLPSTPGRELLPPIKDPILLKSCVELAQLIRDRDITAESVVKAFISRIQDCESYVNGMVDTCFDEAIKEAKRIDGLDQVAFDEETEHRCMLGVPFIGKDSIGAKGMASTCGLIRRRGMVCEVDSPCVANLKAAGCIILGISNIPELAMWFDSDNKLYGRANNPHDLGRIPGGSTGGGAAVLSYGGAPLLVGGDIGGSIRMPAFFNGTFGHKPSPFLTPKTGHYPPIPDVRDKMFSFGPLVRKAEDLVPITRIFIGEKFDELDMGVGVSDWTDIKVYILANGLNDPYCTIVQKEIKDSILCVGKMFQDLKAKVTYELPQDIMDLFQYSFDMFEQVFKSPEADSMASQLGIEGHLLREWGRLMTGRSDHVVANLAQATNSYLTGDIGNPVIVSKANELKRLLNTLLGRDGILIIPTHPMSAPKHHTTLALFHNTAYTAVFNVLETPITACPLGVDRKGLPIGCQAVAAFNQDRLTLAAAIELERHFGGWISPTPIFV